MRIPWNFSRCIVCVEAGTPTDEHVIPRALGGRLVGAFLCRSCNSRLGYATESAARSDPAIRIMANELAPELASRLSERQPYLGHGSGGEVDGYIRDGDFRIRSQKAKDGSLIQETVVARCTIERILQRAACPAPVKEAAIRRFDAAVEGIPTILAPGLQVVKWPVNELKLLLSSPLMGLLAPIKMAYEFVAPYLGAAIYKDDPNLNEIRSALRGESYGPEAIVVERLEAAEVLPMHGIVFEGNRPHAQVQVRLFGKLVFLVHFRFVAISGPRYCYSYDIAASTEDIRVLDS